jgi:GT2 family glycosyltransferase
MIYLVSDFLYEEISGGAEYVDRYFLNNMGDVKFLKCESFTELNYSKADQYIISNFSRLSEKVKKVLIQNSNYVIVEHDYKFVRERNPIKYPNFKVPFDLRVNALFYNAAKAVFAQSDYHADILRKNLPFSNVISFQGTFYEESHLDLLDKISKERTVKTNKFAVLESKYGSKGRYETEKFCRDNKIEYDILPRMEYKQFLKKLSEYSGLVFLPQSPETFCKLIYEAKVIGLKIKTNKNSGVIHEKWIKDKDLNLIEYIRNKQKYNLNLVLEKLNEEFAFKPVLTEVVSLFKAKRFLNNFLKNLISQSLFKHTEVLVIDCNPSNYTEDNRLLQPFLDKYKNIKVIHFDKDPGVYGAWNAGIKAANTEFVCNSNTDDLRFTNSTEEMVHSLQNSESVLVYGDSRVMTEYGIVSHQRSEHSLKDFSKEDMVKCLPGAIPLWKKEVHDEHGYFDEKYSSAADWEFWLRMVQSGETFLKLSKDIGAYYLNPGGISTNKNDTVKRFNEEKEIFFKYKDLFGRNYDKYKNYFGQ